jgi:hypothetical protein
VGSKMAKTWEKSGKNCKLWLLFFQNHQNPIKINIEMIELRKIDGGIWDYIYRWHGWELVGTCGYPSSSAGHTQRIQYQSISVPGMSGWKPMGWHVFVQSLDVWIGVTRSKLPAEFGRMRNCEKFVSQRKNHKNPRKRKKEYN